MSKKEIINSIVSFDFVKQDTAGVIILTLIVIFKALDLLNSLENFKNHNQNKKIFLNLLYLLEFLL